MGICALPISNLIVLSGDYKWMEDRIQELALFFVRKHDRTQKGPIECAVLSENFASKSLNDRFQSGGTRFHYLTRSRIGVKNAASELSQDAQHERLSDCNRSGKADFQHNVRKALGAAGRTAQVTNLRYRFRRHFAACSVFLISMATVRRPTPPGTGVRQPATASASVG